MEIARARCRKCDAPMTANENVVFPKTGGVEHLDCDKARKPLARAAAPTPPTPPTCLACELPVLAGDKVVLVGHDLLHAACRHRLGSISGASGPPAHRLARALVPDPFARAELLMSCHASRLDAADVRARSRHLRQIARAARAATDG